MKSDLTSQNMKSPISVEVACERYIRTVNRVKKYARDEDEFWSNPKANAAFRQIHESIASVVDTKLQWSYTISELAGAAAEAVWGCEDEIDESDQIKFLLERVNSHLKALQGYDWIASIPMEHLFNRFPEVTDFGSFALINPTSGNTKLYPINVDEVTQRFGTILTEHFNVNTGELDNAPYQTYAELGSHYCRKTSGYIPGRPQMLIKVGVGDERVNNAILSGEARFQTALLAICQISYELDRGFMLTNVMSPGQCCTPMGDNMQDGLIEVPNAALAIVASTGEATLWNIPQLIYETQFGMAYEPGKFLDKWNAVATPVTKIKHVLEGPIGTAIRNSISMVAKCRHRKMGDLLLNSVVAAETLLYPFKARGTTEGFSVFASKLTGNSLDERIAIYGDARRLYDLRSNTVHGSHSGCDDREVKEHGNKAFNLFLGCLKAVVGWATELSNTGKECNEKEFRQFYLKTILE